MRKILLIACCICAAYCVHAQSINAAEFYIDNDPGTGNATAMSVGTTGDIVIFTKSIATTGLQQGFHLIGIRVQNTSGIWSIPQNKGFFLLGAPVSTTDISAAEFFIDNDPGSGNGTSINIGSSGADVNFVANISSNALSNGFHILCIRVKNTSGTWSLFEKYGFYVSTIAPATGNITAAEFFLDTDPGTGNAQPISIATPGADVTKSFSFTLPNGLANGNHFVGVRFKDANGIWGLFDFDTIGVTGSLPLHILSFDGTNHNNINSLKWATPDEVNTNYFDIERSSNGISFVKIGEVKTASISGINNDYSFSDNHPANGYNFYRLKEFDKDGSFYYSEIIRLSNNTNNKLMISPNPAKDIIRLSFATNADKIVINIFDVNGRMVLLKNIPANPEIPLNISNLASGAYYVHISDGLQQQNGTFVKE